EDIERAFDEGELGRGTRRRRQPYGQLHRQLAADRRLAAVGFFDLQIAAFVILHHQRLRLRADQERLETRLPGKLHVGDTVLPIPFLAGVELPDHREPAEGDAEDAAVAGRDFAIRSANETHLALTRI